MASPSRASPFGNAAARVAAQQERLRRRREELGAVAEDVAQLRKELPATPQPEPEPSSLDWSRYTSPVAERTIGPPSGAVARELSFGETSAADLAADVRSILMPGTAVGPRVRRTAPRTAVRAPPEVQPSGEQIAHHVPASIEAPARVTHRAQSVAQDIASQTAKGDDSNFEQQK